LYYIFKRDNFVETFLSILKAKAMTASRRPTTTSTCSSSIQRDTLVANEDGIGTTDRLNSSKRLKSLVALMVALQTPTMASTASPPNYHHPPRTIIEAQEQSSKNNPKRKRHHHQLQQNNKNSHFLSDYNPLSSLIYLSDDEEEKRVLSALAKADDGETTNSWTVDDDDDDDNDNDSISSSIHNKNHNNNDNAEEDDDAFLSKLRQFKRTLRQTTTRSVNLTAPIAYSGDEEDKEEIKMSTSNQQPEEEEPQELPNKAQSTQEDNRPGSKNNVTLRLAKLEAAISRQSFESYASPSFLPNRPSARPGGAGAQSPSITARSFPVRHQTSELRSAARQPQHPSIQHSSSAVAANVKSHKPGRTSVIPSLSANIRQQSTVLQRTTDPTPISPGRSSSLTADNDVSPWVRRFLSTRPKDCLMLVPRDYLMDNFNLARLPPVVEHLAAIKQKEMEAPSPNLEQRASLSMSQQLQQHPTRQDPQQEQQTAYPIYRQALDLILGQGDDKNIEKPTPLIQYAAEVLYCLVHARFVVSPRGLDTIRSRMIIHGSHRINQPLFGRCPRLRCGGMPLLPCGLSDDYDPDGLPGNTTSRAKRYCCNCREKFHFWESKVQGCAWAGMSLCHLLLLVYGTEELFPSHFVASDGAVTHGNALESSSRPQESVEKQEPGRIFGFPIHPLVQSW
jgi:Casein kinase II regulatory subunit